MLTSLLQSVEAEVRDRERDLREQESATRQVREERDRVSREKESREREMKGDMRKLMKEMQRLQKRHKMKEGRSLLAVVLMQNCKRPDTVLKCLFHSRELNLFIFSFIHHF